MKQACYNIVAPGGWACFIHLLSLSDKRWLLSGGLQKQDEEAMAQLGQAACQWWCDSAARYMGVMMVWY